MTTTDDRDRDGNISNGTTHIMSSHHSAFRFFFTRKRKLVTAMLWPLRWLFSVTFWLLFGHEDPFKKITKKKIQNFLLKTTLVFVEKFTKTRVLLLPHSFQLCSSWRHLTRKKTKQNENQLLPRFCESMGDQILSLFCVYCSTRRSRMGVLLGCMTRLLGYFLSAVFFCYLLVRHWDKLLLFLSPYIFVSLFSYW
jgi:hypothetical protein